MLLHARRALFGLWRSGLRAYPHTLRADLLVAARNVLRQRRRSLVAGAAIALGVVSMMLAAGYMDWLFWAIREEAIANRLGHLQIVKPGYHQHGQAESFSYLLPLGSRAINQIEGTDGVIAVAPRLNFSGLLSYGDHTLSFLGEALDPELDPSVRTIALTAGQSLTRAQPRSVLIGSGLASNLGVKPGDRVVLLATTAAKGINAVEVEVRGLFTSGLKAYDDTVIRAPIDLAHDLLRVSGAHIWVVSLQDTDLTEAVHNRLRALPVLSGMEVVTWRRLADFYHKVVELFSRQLAVVNLVIAGIIVLSIGNTMSMSVLERTREIGTLMAIGFRRRRILTLFILEGGLLGMFGGLGGIALGYALAETISWIGIPMPPPPGRSVGYVAAINTTPEIIVDAFLLAVTTTLVASVYPAWRASRLVIVDALRHNR